jgi:hypothetical protein
MVFIVAIELVALSACSTDRVRQDACRGALRAAWRAYTVQPPTPDDRRSQSEARFDSEGRTAIASLDSARAALPAGGGPEDRFLSATLGGLVATLRNRHDAQVGGVLMGRENAAAMASQDVIRMKDTYDRGFDLLKAEAEADGVAERTILQLAAWERRFLRENYLADSYVGRLLAMVEDSRAKGAPDSTLLHRPEIEARIASWDVFVVGEIRSLK